MDQGSPPAGLPTVVSYPGIGVSSDEVIQLPLFILTSDLSVLIPKRTVFGTGTTYRLTAAAQTPSGAQGAQSFVLRQGLADAADLSTGD